MKQATISTESTEKIIEVTKPANGSSVLGRIFKSIATIFNLGVEQKICSDDIYFDRTQDLSDFQFSTLAMNVGCDLSSFDEYTSMLSDESRNITMDYVQGVSITSISRSRGIRRADVVKQLSSLQTLIHG